MADENSPKKRRWDWLLWWQIDPIELEKQVTQYENLKFIRSARGQAVGCILFSVAVTAAFIYFSIMDSLAYIDIAIMVMLCVFIYFGHRWAMIVAMVFWTLEKAYGLFAAIGGPGHGNNLVLQVIWWTIYMHAFYFSYCIEQERRKRAMTASLPA